MFLLPFNWLVIPTLMGSYALFWAGIRLSSTFKTPIQRLLLGTVGTILAVPGVLIAAYYLHFFDSWAWFYRFRSIPGTELTAGAMGLLGGCLAYWCRKAKKTLLLSDTGLAAIMTMGIILPHAKPLLASPDLSQFHDSWDGMICRQSTGYSCGVACAATLLKSVGIAASEKELARECFTYKGGTENWYIARALRRRGLKVTFQINTPDELKLPTPSIAGVNYHGVGHFVTVLEETDTGYIVGDPLLGRRLHQKATIRHDIDFTGFFMAVTMGEEVSHMPTSQHVK